jgi:4-hydroxy-3-polyprenylbenzoate decarboxylase
MGDDSKRIIVGISGASGVIYGIDLLKALRDCGCESHLVLSEWARKNILLETDYTVAEVERFADHVYDDADLAAPIASGSFITRGMVIAPCTIKTLSAIAHSYNVNLMTRAADVALKERRSLVLVVRETPLHKGHLELMLTAANLGAVILPPLPAFYHRPATIDDIVRHTTGKVLDSLKIHHDLFHRWQGA